MDFYISISTISGSQNVKVDHHTFVPEGQDPQPILAQAVTEAAATVIADAEAAYQRTQPTPSEAPVGAPVFETGTDTQTPSTAPDSVNPTAEPVVSPDAPSEPTDVSETPAQ